MTETLGILVDLNYSGLQSKIESMIGTVSDSFDKLSSKNFKWDQYFNGEGINWTSLVSKLFAPANLIAFFSAMAATGIIASISNQSAGSGAGGSTGTGGGAGGTIDQQYASQAGTIAGNVGTLAGGTSDIASAIAQIYQVLQPYGGTVQDATNATQVLVEALETTGGQLSDAVGPIITDIKEAGITTAGGITDFIGALEEASQAAGGAGQGASIANVASASSTTITQAEKAGTTIQGIISLVQELGSMAASIGFPQAVTELQEMGTLLDSNVDREILELPNLATVINTQGANAAFDLMNNKIATIAPTLDPAVYSVLNLNSNILNAVAAFEKFETPITNTYNGIVSLGSPTANVAKQFADYDNIILAGNEAINLMEQSLAQFVNAPLLTTLLNGFDDVLSIIKDITTWLNTGGLLSDVSTGSVLGFLVQIVPSLAGAAGTLLSKVGSFFSTATSDVVGAGKSLISDVTGSGGSSGLVDASGAPLASSAASAGSSGLLDTLLSPSGIGAIVGALYNYLVPAAFGGGVQSAGGSYPTGASSTNSIVINNNLNTNSPSVASSSMASQISALQSMINNLTPATSTNTTVTK